jgi:hypothetical protein
MDSKKNNEFYLAGLIDNYGGVMKLNRNDATVNWYKTYTSITQITSYLTLDDE